MNSLACVISREVKPGSRRGMADCGVEKEEPDCASDWEDSSFVSPGREEEDAEHEFNGVGVGVGVREGEGEGEGEWEGPGTGEEDDDGVDWGPSEDGKCISTEMGSSSSDENHIPEMLGDFQSNVIGSRNGGMISPLFTQKKDKGLVEINDLVKNNVLPFLPAKSLIRFRAVSKEWDRWISSPFLAHKQSYHFRKTSGFFCQSMWMSSTFLSLNHHAYGIPTPSLSFFPKIVRIRSSSNGLLLCQGINEDKAYYVCNPANNTWAKLPTPGYYHGSEPAIILAFEPSVLNMDASYQLICAVPLLDQPIILFQMYSSKTGCWRESDNICMDVVEDFTFTGNGFYMKGTAYWETSSRKILAFNPKNGIHGTMPLPSECPQGILTEMRGELCYIGMSVLNQNASYIEIYGGVDLSFKHKVKVPFDLAFPLYQILHCADDNVVMILNGETLYSYNLADQTYEVIRVESQPGAKYFPYVNSLVHVG